MNILGNSQEFLIRELIVEEVDKVLLGRAILPFGDRAEDGLVERPERSRERYCQVGVASAEICQLGDLGVDSC